MKRTFMGLVSVTCLFLCTACGGGGSSAKAEQRLDEGFAASFVMEIDGLTAEGTVTKYAPELWSAAFDSPSEVAGVVLDFAGDDVTASYKGLAFSVPQAAMPSKALLLRFIEAVDEIADEDDVSGKEKDGLVEYEGELDGEPYYLYLNSDGSPAEFRMENMGGFITFTNFTSDVVMTTTVTTIESLVITTSETAASE